jgi:dihydrofolate synthase/folylpolyglutamate synthase
MDITLAVREQAEAMEDHPTEFEMMTAVALMHFAREKCEFAVLEVGLGGRLDSTNVVDFPEVCVIAPISLDHTALLGDTIAEIAEEKAGIIKPGAAVVSAPQDPDALHVIHRVCSNWGCMLSLVDEAQLSGTPRDFTYRNWEHLSIGLLGSYQTQNAALAIETIERLRQHGVEISDDDLRAGLANTRWPGRFEVVSHHPEFVIDGGHNPQGAQALVDSLQLNYPGRPVFFIVGVLEDKDYPQMLETIMPHGTQFFTIEPPNPRALSAYKLARAIRFTCQDMMGCTASHNAHETKSIPDAVAQAREAAGEEGVVCAFGSLYSIADIMVALREQGALED